MQKLPTAAMAPLQNYIACRLVLCHSWDLPSVVLEEVVELIVNEDWRLHQLRRPQRHSTIQAVSSELQACAAAFATYTAHRHKSPWE